MGPAQRAWWGVGWEIDSIIPKGLRPSAQGCRNAERVENRIHNPKGITSFSPGLPQRGYPGKRIQNKSNPNGVAPRSQSVDQIPSGIIEHLCRNPVGVGGLFGRLTQGSRVATTLGWRAKSRWDLIRWCRGTKKIPRVGGRHSQPRAAERRIETFRSNP